MKGRRACYLTKDWLAKAMIRDTRCGIRDTRPGSGCFPGLAASTLQRSLYFLFFKRFNNVSYFNIVVILNC
jgi:hypothetical protein